MKYKDIIKKMTLREKASLMSGKDFWHTKDIKRLGINSIFLVDGPHGLRKQKSGTDFLGIDSSEKATCFPAEATIANSWDVDLAELVGKCIGEEAASQRINVLLGPGVNIKRNPLCGRNFEYYSEDPYLSGKMASGFIRGVQANGISACLKHLCANNQEERRMAIDSIIDERTLREIYLTPFEIAINEGRTKAVMSSYNRVNGTYTNENNHIMNEILRNEWGFKGCVVTDWGGSNDRVAGLIAGNELEMPTTGGETDEEIIKAVESGRIKEEVLDECVDRLLDLIITTEESFKKNCKKVNIEEHHKAAEKAAEESIVLLKNEDGILPIEYGTKVAIIGDFAEKPRYQGKGSSLVNPFMLENSLDCFKDSMLIDIGYEPGFDRYGKKNKRKIDKACELAKKADMVILYIGLDEFAELEGMDRKNMRLPQNQIDLIEELYKVNPNIVAVLSCGCVIEMPWIDKIKCLLHCYLGGQAGGKAVVKVLCGDINPSGKLAETYPLRYEDTPSYRYFPGREVSAEYREGIYVGYRYYDKTDSEVLFPFGYGLSYTEYKYSNIDVSSDSVSFDITNVGERAGKEIAQMYVKCRSDKIFRPNKELKGFVKVYIEPGDTRKITIPFDNMTFRYFNVKTNKWEIESSEYTIMIGSSSRDIKLAKTIFIEGTCTEGPYDKNKIKSYYSGNVNDVSTEEFKELYGSNVPDSRWDRTKDLSYTDTVSQCMYAKGIIARLSYHMLILSHEFFTRIGERDIAEMVIMSIYNMPFRGIARFTAGMINMKMVDGVLLIVNGNLFKGVSKFVKERNKLIKKAIQ